MAPLPSFSERQVATALRDQIPIQGLPEVSIEDVKEKPTPFDISFELRSGKTRVRVLGEIKQMFSPRTISEITPWVRRLKNLRPDVAIALIAPALSEQSQSFGLENGIDFLDLAGNISINIPGKFTLRRTGLRARVRTNEPSQISAQTSNVFSGRYSRVLRVILEKPKLWTLTEIGKELDEQTRRLPNAFRASTEVSFSISPGTISKALASLEEQLLIRRRGTAVIVPEPKRVLLQWAEKYKERCRWRLRSSFQTGNPFGRDLVNVKRGIDPLVSGYAFTAAATSAAAPFIDLDVLDIFLLPTKSDNSLRELESSLQTARLHCGSSTHTTPECFSMLASFGKFPWSPIFRHISTCTRGAGEI